MLEEEGAEAQEAQAPEADTLRTQIGQLEKDLESAKGEAKAHQKYGEKTKGELDKQRGLEDKIDRIEGRMTVVTEMLAETMDRDSDEIEEQPKKRRSEEYLSRIDRAADSTKQTRKQAVEAEFAQVAREADALLKVAGLEMDKSPEAKDAYIQFLLGNPEAGLEEVRRIVGSKTEAKQDVDMDVLVEEKARKILEESGQLKTDTITPVGGAGRIWTRSEIDTMSGVDYAKNFPNGYTDVLSAVNEGRIKE